MTTRERILLEARLWRMEKEHLDPSYFKNLARKGRPSMLWIESYGNPTPIHELINVESGDLMVHRNIGGICRSDDSNLSTAVEHFVGLGEGADLIIICGHSQCEIIREVVAGGDNSGNSRWSEELRELYDQHAHEMSALNARQKERKLSELNVQRQVANLSRFEALQNAWSSGRQLTILGWYFDIPKGEVHELYAVTSRDLAQVAAETRS